MSKEFAQEATATPTAVMEPAQEHHLPPISRPAAKKVVRVRSAQDIDAPRPVSPVRKKRPSVVTPPLRNFPASQFDDDSSNRQAELFYLQKQIQQQTPMVFILENGERIQGVVEWYDRNSIKVRGKSRVLIYKTAIKYIYKAGEIGSSPEK